MADDRGPWELIGLSRREFLARAATTGALLTSGSFLAACGLGAPKPADTGFGPAKYTWRLSAVNGPGNPLYDSILNLVELVRVKTKGAVKIEVYGNSQLGSETDNFKNMQNGTVQIGFMTSSVANAAVPETLLYNLPYVFKDPVSAQKAYNGPAKEAQEKKLADIGIKVLAWQNAGIRHIGGKKLYRVPDDLKGVKIRVLSSPLFISLFKSFGAVPTTLAPADVYGALQQGVISAYDQPLTGIDSMKWYEVGPAISLTYHTYSIQMLAMNKQTWDALPKNLQTAVAESATQNVHDQDQTRINEEGNVQKTLESKGANFVKPDLAPWRQIAQSLYPQYAAQVGGMSVIDKLLATT